MSKRKTQTIKDIALCFGERIGFFVTPRQIRIRGNWLFYKPYDLEDYEIDEKKCIDCYFAPDAHYDSGVLSMIPYTGVKLKDSPFIKDNNEKVAESLKKLDKSYKEYLEDIAFRLHCMTDSAKDNLYLLIRQGVE